MPSRRPMDPQEQEEWVEARYDVAHWQMEGLERAARYDPTHWSSVPLCPICGRVKAAEELCGACGDADEMEAA